MFFYRVGQADAGKGGDGGRTDLIRAAVRSVDTLARVPDALTVRRCVFAACNTAGNPFDVCSPFRSLAVLLNRCGTEFLSFLESIRAEKSGGGSSTGPAHGGAGAL